MNGMLGKRWTSGFTLPELMMVIGIAAILLTIGVPSFKYVTVSNRISTEVNGLLGDMQFARSMAVKQGQSVTVCASTDQATCSQNPVWQTGWIVFLDSNNNQTVDAPNEAVIRAQPGFSSTDTLLPDNGAFTAITFNRAGYAATGAAATVTLQLHDAAATASLIRCLAISPMGMLTTQKSGVGNCT